MEIHDGGGRSRHFGAGRERGFRVFRRMEQRDTEKMGALSESGAEDGDVLRDVNA